MLTLKHKSEQVVTAGTPLLEIGDDKDLEITLDLLSSDAVKVKKGASVMIDGWGASQQLRAVVRHIEPAGFTKISALGIEEQRVKTVLDLLERPKPPLHLGHDFRVFAHIRVWEGEDLVLVPLAALFRKGNDWVVFVEQNGKATLRRISIDHRTSHYAQVIEGLSAGDKVILHPSDQIFDGTSIARRPYEE